MTGTNVEEVRSKNPNDENQRNDFSFFKDFKKPRTHARKAMELKQHVINVLKKSATNDGAKAKNDEIRSDNPFQSDETLPCFYIGLEEFKNLENVIKMKEQTDSKEENNESRS